MQADEMDEDELAAHVRAMSPIREMSDEEKSFASSSTDCVESLSAVSAVPYRGALSNSSSDDDDIETHRMLSPLRHQRQNLNRSFMTPDRKFGKQCTPFQSAVVASPKKRIFFDEDSCGTVTGDAKQSGCRIELAELRDSNFDADKSFLSSTGDLNDSFVSSVGGNCGGAYLSNRKMSRFDGVGAGAPTRDRHNCSISPISSPMRGLRALKLRDNIPTSPASIVQRSMNSAVRSRNASDSTRKTTTVPAEMNDSGGDFSSFDSGNMVRRKLRTFVDDSAYETSAELSPGGNTSGNSSALSGIADSAVNNGKTTKRSLDSSLVQASPAIVVGNYDHAAKKRAACTGVSRIESDFEYERTLGHGAFGVVLLCRNRLDGQSYAIKKLDRPRRGSVDEKRALMEVWAHAWPGSCKHLVRYYSAWVEAEFMYVQNEYCNGGSLEAFLQRRRREIAVQQQRSDDEHRLQEAELAQILLHMAAALHDMHRRKIAHLDVKPANIFLCRPERTDVDAVTKSGGAEVDADIRTAAASFDCATSSDGVTYKLGDLGRVMSFRDMEHQQQNGTNVVIDEGDSRYMAPELLRWRYASVEKADIYSLGLTVYEAGGCGPLPKSGIEWEELRQNPSKLQLPQCSPAFNLLLQKLVSIEPAERPSASDILRHPTLVPEKTSDELKRELNAARFDNHILSRQLKEYEKLAAFYHRPSTMAALFTHNSNAPICWASSLHAAAEKSSPAVSNGAPPAVMRTSFCPPQLPHQQQHYLMCRPRLPVCSTMSHQPPRQLDERYAVPLPPSTMMMPSPSSGGSVEADNTENHNAFINNNVLRPFLKARKPSTKTLCHANSCTY